MGGAERKHRVTRKQKEKGNDATRRVTTKEKEKMEPRRTAVESDYSFKSPKKKGESGGVSRPNLREQIQKLGRSIPNKKKNPNY